MSGLPVKRGVHARAFVRTGAAALAVAGLTIPAVAYADAQTSREAYQKALGRFQAGDLRSARIELLTALKENKDNALARILFARVLLARGDGVAAQTEIERAIGSGFPKEKTNHLTANALLLQRQYSRALDVALAKNIPPQFGSYGARMRGRAQMGLLNKQAAASEFGLATRIAPGNPDTWVDLARFQIGEKDLPRGSASIDRALVANPNHVPALLLRAGLVRATAGLEASLPIYTKVVAIDGNNVEALLERAATYGDLNKEKEAKADIDKVKGLIPNHPLAVYLEAVLYARGGKFQQAQDTLNLTKGVLADFLPAQMLQGMVALQLGNVAQANEAFNKVVAAAPQNLAARRMLGFTQLRTGDAVSAMQTLDPLTKIDINQLDASTLGLLGTVYAQTGKLAESQKYFERASAVASNKAPMQTQLAMTKLAQGDLSGAELGLDQALKSDPNSVQALMSLVLVNLRERDYSGAMTAAERLVTAHPNLPIGYNMRGVARLGRRDAKGAEADFRAALAKDPKYPDARRNLAQLLIGTNRRAEGEAELKTLTANDPKDATSLMLFAQSAMSRGATNEAIEALRRAVIAQPNAVPPRSALVQAYLAAKQPAQAITEATSLVRGRPSDPAAIRVLAATQFAAKQPNNAVQTLQGYATSRPTDPRAAMMLADGYMAANRPADAKRTLENALRMPNAPTDAIYVGMIRIDTLAKNYSGALASAEKLKASTKSPLAADKLMGDIYIAANRPADAIAAYQRVSTGAKTAQAAGLVAGAQLRAGRNKDALATLQQYRRANPTDVAGAVLLADLQTGLQDWRGAIATYESIGNSPAANSPLVLNNLAWAYAQVGDRRALPTAARAYQRAPNAAEIIDTYGWLLVSTRSNPKQGLELLQKAAKASPQNPTIRYHLGMAYRANGMANEAKRELAMAANANAGGVSAQARQALGALR